MRRFSSIFAALVLCGLTSIACKQNVGERCEQPSDCASGYCGGSATISMMTSVMGRMCTAGPGSVVPVDAAPPPTDTAAATDGATGDTVADARADAATEAGAEVGGGDAGVDGSPDASTDTSADVAHDGSAADGGSDAGLEAGPG